MDWRSGFWPHRFVVSHEALPTQWRQGRSIGCLGIPHYQFDVCFGTTLARLCKEAKCQNKGLLSTCYSTVLNLADPHQIQHLDTSVMTTLTQVLPVFGYLNFCLTFGSEQSGKGMHSDDKHHMHMNHMNCIFFG